MKIVVATHKPYSMPEGKEFLPLQVGAVGKNGFGIARDDDGDNISAKNPGFCELTGLYWAWKHLDEEDAIGLVHYRRLFKAPPGWIAATLDHVSCILPKPRNYFIETTYGQYVHAHHAQDLDTTRAILAERHPEFLDAFDATMASTKGHRFNMFVMKRPLFDDYCRWLFDVLFELERRLDVSDYSPYDARVFGFVAERLLDVYVTAQKVSYAECPVLNLESQHWPKKILAFLGRKLLGSPHPFITTKN